MSKKNHSMINAIEWLYRIRPLIATNKETFNKLKEQQQLRHNLDMFFFNRKASERKKSIFTDRSLPYHTEQELDKILSPAEKKLAESTEHSGSEEATESYHYKNNLKIL